MKLIEEAFRYVEAQRLIRFYVPIHISDKALFQAFNYEFAKVGRPATGKEKQGDEKAFVLCATKRSQFYLSDCLRPLPQVTDKVCADIDSLTRLTASYNKWSKPSF